MSFSLRPDYTIRSLFSLTPEILKRIGADLLLLDLDNTISPYDEKEPGDKVLAWAENMKKGGIRLYIVSNSKKIRPDVFAEKMGIPFIKYAKKPSTKMVHRAIAQMDGVYDRTALAGDQIFTDVLAANRAGIKSILVEPIKFTNPFLKLRYIAETPFRKMFKNQL